MTHSRIVAALVLAVAACGFPRPPDVPGADRQVGGKVQGLWQGADGVALRLQADGVDTLLAIPGNGDFHFDDLLPEGTSYTVTVAASPPHHTCTIEAGQVGKIVDADANNVQILCAGPAVSIALSGQWGWTFDPEKAVQTFSGSAIAQEVSLTITGDELASSRIDGHEAAIGAEAPPVELRPGTTTISVELSAGGSLSRSYQLVFERDVSKVEQTVYGKPASSSSYMFFGSSVAVSNDTIAVSTQAAFPPNIVYVFVREGTTWTQQAMLTGTNTEMGDQFGYSIALSGDTLAVGAPLEDSGATGVNSSNQGNAASDSGAVYIFARSGTSWIQQAYVKASNTRPSHRFGSHVSLLDGTLAVGAPGEDGRSSGVNPEQIADANFVNAGAAYIFLRNGTNWSQQVYIKASNTGSGDNFGQSVSLSEDRLAIGAPNEDSSATGVNGNQLLNDSGDSGAIYVYQKQGNTWQAPTYIKTSDTRPSQKLGTNVALAGDTLASTGVGAAYVFAHSAPGWSQTATLTANTQAAAFGSALALSRNVIAVGATTSATVHLFVQDGSTWNPSTRIVRTEHTGHAGRSIALSNDQLVVGDDYDTCLANGINPPSCPNFATYGGAFYVFR